MPLSNAQRTAAMSCCLVALLASCGAAGGLDDFHWREEFTDAGRFTAQVSWLSNPSKTASVAIDGEAAVFRVDEPRRGMKWSAPTPLISLADTPWLVLRYRAEKLNTQSTDYLVYLDDRVKGKQLNALRLCDAEPDGPWHTVAVDVSTLTNAAGVHGLAVQVQATGEGRARLWLDWMAFVPEPPEGAERLRVAQPPAAVLPDWVAPLEKAKWVHHNGWLSNPASEGKHSVGRGPSTLAPRPSTLFRVSEPGRGMKWSWDLPEEAPLEGHRYVAMRYRARGLRPVGDYALCVLGKPRGDGLDYTSAIGASELLPDGRWHTLTVDVRKVAAEYPQIGALAVQVQAASPDASLEIADIRFANAVQPSRLADALDWEPQKRIPEPFSAIPIEGNTDSGAWRRHLRLADWFTSPVVAAEGIPFQRTGPAARELAGTGVRERAELRFPADVAASEVTLLAFAACIGPEEPVYGGGQLRAIRDVDRFRLRLEYADGAADECLPMNVATKEFGLVEGPQVLVAAADRARKLKAVVLRDACSQAAFAVAAITARTGGAAAFPEALEVHPPLRRAATRSHEPSVLRELGLLAQEFRLRVDGRDLPGDALKPTAVDKSLGLTVFQVAGVPGLTLSVRIPPARRTARSRAVAAVVRNHGPRAHKVGLVAPSVGPYRLCERAEDAFYLVPRRGAAFGHRPCSYRERYCGTCPVQFLDTFCPKEGLGLSLRVEDTVCTPKHFLLRKEGAALTLGVEYRERLLKPGETFETPTAVITVTDGDWHSGFEAYRGWLKSWHKPLAPRKPWFREVFNFRQRFLWRWDPLYDARAGEFHLERAIDEAKREFGGIDYLHIFDWGNCGSYGRIYGRTGDYSPYDYLEGGRPAFRQAIASVQKQGVPTGLYIEGYLLTARGKLGEAHGKDWQIIGPSGKGLWWTGNTEMMICPGAKAWREVQASTYETKVKELGVDGMYIDQFGFANAWKDCYSDKHGHPVPSSPARTERDMTRLIRQRVEAAKKGVAIYTEETPVDVTTPLQDGSFTYAMATSRRTQTLVPINIARFAFPDFKTIEILVCDKPTGSWATGVRWVFFNGEAIWLEGEATAWFEPETRAEIRRCYRILRKHKDAFTSLAPVPLVPTEMGGVWANAFPVAGKTVYTLYNARHRTVRGEVLRVPHTPGATFTDEWHQKPAAVRIDGKEAVLATEIGPHGVGCLVVEKPQTPKP